MSDLIAKVRAIAEEQTPFSRRQTLREAADEIERLRALLKEVRAWMFDCGESGDPWEEKFVAQIDAALAEKPK